MFTQFMSRSEKVNDEAVRINTDNLQLIAGLNGFTTIIELGERIDARERQFIAQFVIRAAIRALTRC